MSLETTNYLFGLGTFGLQLAVAALLVLYLLHDNRSIRPIVEVIRASALHVALLLTLAAVIMSLYYSEILGIEPCPLCWWQRVFLYPQTILFAVALFLRDKGIATYSIALSIPGAVFSLYHHALQVMPAGTLPCPAATVSCAQRFMFEFGYITLPLMGFSLFAFLIVLMLFVRARRVAS